MSCPHCCWKVKTWTHSCHPLSALQILHPRAERRDRFPPLHLLPITFMNSRLTSSLPSPLSVSLPLSQHRMAGLAVLEASQAVAAHWQALAHAGAGAASSREREREREREGGLQPGGQRGGKGGKGSTAPAGSGLTWRQLYSIAVRWRQLSEPCDPVLWVDQLT